MIFKKKTFLLNWLRQNFIVLFFLSLLVVLAYANSLGNDFVSDDLAIKNSREIGKISYFTSRPHAFIQPLIYFTIYKIAGLNPLFFRLNNIIFHWLTVITIYLLFYFLTDRITSFVTASVFAVHPVLTEAVTWISGGNYVRYGYFFISSFLFYHLSVKFKSRKAFFCSLFFLILSLISLPNSIAFFVVILLYQLVFLKSLKKWKQLLLIIFISLSSIIYYLSQLGIRAQSVAVQAGKAGSKFYNPLEQLPFAVVNYLKLIIWPVNLTLYHSETTLNIFQFSLYLAAFVLLLGVIVYFFNKNRLIFFWLMFFIIVLSPTLTPFKINWIVAERYAYLASLGIIFLPSYFLAGFIKNKNSKVPAVFIYVSILILLLTRTILRNVDWKNEDNLWPATVKSSPNYSVSHNNMGDVYSRQGNDQLAAMEFKKAIELRPDYAEAYHNLGNVYWHQGKKIAALQSFSQALELNPAIWQSDNNIGLIYFTDGNYDQAEKYVRKALKIVPDIPDLNLNLAVILIKTGRANEGKRILLQILKLDPQNQRANSVLRDLNK